MSWIDRVDLELQGELGTGIFGSMSRYAAVFGAHFGYPAETSSGHAVSVPVTHPGLEHSVEEYGAVERSPVYVQFSNAGVLLTNLAIEESLGVASVSVAPIVPRTRPRLVRTIMTSR